MSAARRDLTDTGETEAIADKIAPKLADAMTRQTAKSSDLPAISESSFLRVSVRAAVSCVAAVVAVVLAGAGGYYALASADRTLETRTANLESRASLSATKADLRELRLQVRMDLVSAIWSCSKDAAGGMQCRSLPARSYDVDAFSP